MFKNIVLVAMAMFFAFTNPVFAGGCKGAECSIWCTAVPAKAEELRLEFQDLHQEVTAWNKKYQEKLAPGQESFQIVITALEKVQKYFVEAHMKDFDKAHFSNFLFAAFNAYLVTAEYISSVSFYEEVPATETMDESLSKITELIEMLANSYADRYPYEETDWFGGNEE